MTLAKNPVHPLSINLCALCKEMRLSSRLLPLPELRFLHFLQVEVGLSSLGSQSELYVWSSSLIGNATKSINKVCHWIMMAIPLRHFSVVRIALAGVDILICSLNYLTSYKHFRQMPWLRCVCYQNQTTLVPKLIGRVWYL